MNPYAAQRLTRERTAEFQAQAARPRPAGNRGATIRHQTGWALIQIGLALVTSAQRRHRAIGPELP
jgi:hypothetical protein